MNIPILGTGLSGLVGSRITELLSDRYEFDDLSFATGVDITNYDQLLGAFTESEAKTVLHMAAMTDVDGCEDEKILGEESKAWLVNVVGTENVVAAAKKTGKKVIYISTDYVFDGTKDYYTEEDTPNPINWYSVTKYEGEKIVQSLGQGNYCIARLAYPYRANFPLKADFLRRILSKIQEGKPLYALTDHIFTPTFIDDLAAAFAILIEKNAEGIFHLVGSENLTPYQAAQKIMEVFGIKSDLKKIERKEYFYDRAYRPFKLALKNDKITKLGANLVGFEAGIREVKRQISVQEI